MTHHHPLSLNASKLSFTPIQLQSNLHSPPRFPWDLPIFFFFSQHNSLRYWRLFLVQHVISSSSVSEAASSVSHNPSKASYKGPPREASGNLSPYPSPHQSVQISTVDKESRTAEVNHVMISCLRFVHPSLHV